MSNLRMLNRMIRAGMVAAIALTCTSPSPLKAQSLATPAQLEHFTASCLTSSDAHYINDHYGPTVTVDACTCLASTLTTRTVGEEYMHAPSNLARKIIEYRIFHHCTSGLYPPASTSKP